MIQTSIGIIILDQATVFRDGKITFKFKKAEIWRWNHDASFLLLTSTSISSTGIEGCTISVEISGNRLLFTED